MMFAFLTMVVLGYLTWRRGYRAARFFFLAWLIFFMAGIMKALVRYGLLPSTGLTEYSVQIGTVFTVLFLALAVPDRINILRQEKEEAQQKALDEIFQAKTQWERTFDAVPDLMAILDNQYRIVKANKAMVNAVGKSPQEAVGKPCYEVIHGRNTPPPFCPHSKLLSDGNEHSAEIMEERFGGIFHVTTSPLHGADGRVTGSVMVARDVTERRKTENAIRESEERYRRIIDNLQDMYYQADMSGCLTFVSPSAQTVFGHAPEKLVGTNMLEMIVKSDIRRQIIKELGENGSIDSFEAELRTLDGRTVWVASSSQVIKDRNGQVIGIEGLLRNITEQKISEEKIRAALAEKEVLMREIHHRVKNNFQVVSGLLTLQSQRIEEDEYLKIFKTTEARIRAMALVHEKLYESENLSEIGIDDYIRSIVRELISFREDCYAAIELKTDLEPLSFGPDTAIPIGLIVTEIVTNAMKHAFPKGVKGEVRIGLHRNNEHGFELLVSDNGIGMANSLDTDNSQSLGLQLVNALVKKLQGEIEIDRSVGTEFKIKFKPIRVRKGN
jgi:PAS domain S-box-containing protein